MSSNPDNLKVGDWVRVVMGDNHRVQIDNGKILQIESMIGNSCCRLKGQEHFDVYGFCFFGESRKYLYL